MDHGFDQWLDLVRMVKDHARYFSSCRRLCSLCSETLRLLMFRFVHWPLFSRELRIRTLMPMLRVGDIVEIEMLNMGETKARLVHHTLAKRGFTFDVEGETHRVNVRQVTYLCML